MDQVEFAHEMGSDSIGVNEHQEHGCGIMPSLT
jgi:hypothetical protein